jgi:hypothetical protein
MLWVLVRSSSHIAAWRGQGADGRNGTVAGKFETVAGFCRDVVFAAGQPGCMGISKAFSAPSSPLSFLTYPSAPSRGAYVLVTSPNSPGTDHILNKIFTSLYGWIAILISFFLATVCVIKEVSPYYRLSREELMSSDK